MMMSRVTRIFLRVVGGLIAGLAVCAVGLVGLFWSGPVSVGFLKPYIEQAAGHAGAGFTVTLDDTILTWAGWDRGIDIRALGVRVATPEGITAAEMPELAVSLSPRALSQGALAPSRIDIFGPEVFIRRSIDGEFKLSFGSPSQSSAVDQPIDSPGITFAERLFGFLNQPPNPENPMTFLNEVVIVGGAVSLFDERTRRGWYAPVANGAIKRGETGLGFEASLTVDLDGTEANLDMVGAINAMSGRVDVGVRFDDLDPATLANIDPATEALAAAEVVLSGTASTTLNANGDVILFQTDVTASAGKITLPDPIGTEMRFQSASVVARYDRDADAVAVDSLIVAFGPDETLTIPALEHTFPVEKLKASGQWSPTAGTASLRSFVLDFGEPTAKVSAEIEGLNSETKSVALSVEGVGVSIDRLGTYWPAALGGDAHEWSMRHFKTGNLDAVTLDAVLEISADDVVLPKMIDGTMSLTDVHMTYIEGMPIIAGVNGEIVYDHNSLTISVSSGESEGLTITGGSILLKDLDTDIEKASVQLDIKGPAERAIAMIDTPVLGFASALGLSSDRIDGSAEIDLDVQFLLKKDLGWDEVQVNARATIENLGLTAAALGQDLKDATGDLVVDNNGLNFQAKGNLGRLPVQVAWRENFSAPRAFKSRYDVQTQVTDVSTLSDLGLDLGPVAADTIFGTVGADIVYTERDVGDAQLIVSANLSDAVIRLPTFDWTKENGQPARADVQLEIRNNLVSIIPSFSLSAPDLDVRGLATFAADGTGLETVQFQRFAFGRTNVIGIIIPRNDGGWDIDFNGESLDLTSVWRDLTEEDKIHKSETEPTSSDSLLPDLTVSMRVDEVWLDEDRKLERLSGAFSRERNRWRSMFVESTGAEDTRFIIRMAPNNDDNRVVTMRAENAGAVVAALGLYENMRGGVLDLQGTFDDSLDEPTLRGTLSVSDYRIVGLPWLARLASLMALTGIAEALQGEGIAFSSLEMPFDRSESTMTITNGKAYGTSLGITVSGIVYQGADALDLNGTIVPAYALNSALGNVPLLGPLFTGGEDGGGVFAAKYTVGGTREDPDVSVNPLSALAPGFLRNIFGILDLEAPQIDPAKTGKVNNPVGQPDQTDQR